MREPNYSSPTQNKAAIVISSTLYDRRALDCTATLPLVNSLTHLAYMTSTSPRIREILATDGGLERIVKILATCHNTDKHSLWKWSLAFQCVVNIGVRGTETIRTRVVEVGTIHVVLAILENFLRALGQAKLEKEQERNNGMITNDNGTALNNNTALSLSAVPLPPQSRSTPLATSRQLSSLYPPASNNDNDNNDPLATDSESLAPVPPLVNATSNLAIDQSLSPTSFSSPSFPTLFSSLAAPKRRTFLTHTAKRKPKNKNTNLSSIPLLNSLTFDAVLHREEDILLSLQLLAYLSKYPHLRQTFHNEYRHNVFSVVEKFTHRIHPQTVIYWAGVIMRNSCRKDESQGGIRQCAYMHCGKWERYPREFAKCRRCRKAKYCSKPCQSRAWAEGHRWWCVERTHTSHPPNTVSTTTTAAAAAAVVAAAPPPDNTEQLGSLDDDATATATTTVTHVPIQMDETRLTEPQQQHTNPLENTVARRQPEAHRVDHDNHGPTPILYENNNDGIGLGLDTEEEDQPEHQNPYYRRSNNNSEQQAMNESPSPPPQQEQQESRLESSQSNRILSTQESLLFYHHHRRRRNSHSEHSSGSSTEVEVDTTEPLQPNQHDYMEIN